MANEFLMEMNIPTPPGDGKFLYLITKVPDTKKNVNNKTNKLWLIILVLMVAVGSHEWTEVHDMNKTLNRTCEVGTSTSLPDYPLSSDGSGLSYPAGGLVSGRPFFCGGKSGGTIRTECYILRGADNKTWELVANLKTARFHHAGVSFGDSLWVTGSYVKLMPGLFKII